MRRESGKFASAGVVWTIADSFKKKGARGLRGGAQKSRLFQRIERDNPIITRKQGHQQEKKRVWGATTNCVQNVGNKPGGAAVKEGEVALPGLMKGWLLLVCWWEGDGLWTLDSMG